MSTASGTQPACTVVDQVTEWTAPDGTLNVAAGDLILHAGQWDQLNWVALSDARDDSERLVLYGLRCDDPRDPFSLKQAYGHEHVTVRRYVEE